MWMVKLQLIRGISAPDLKVAVIQPPPNERDRHSDAKSLDHAYRLMNIVSIRSQPRNQ